MPLRRAISLVLLATAALLGAGCGGGDDEAETDGLPSLVERLPRGEFPGVAALDLVAARDALGISDDVDPRTAILADGDAERRFGFAVGIAIPYLGNPQESPLLDAIDATRFTAAASTALRFGEGAVTVIETEQPFDEIASSLEENGFTRAGDVLTSAEDSVDAAATAIAGGDGVIALGFDAATVEAAASGEPEAPEGAERDLIADLEGPAAIALAVPEDSTACFTAIGFVDRLANGEGEFVVVAEEPSADAFVLDDDADDPFANGFEFDAPTVEDDRVVVPVTYPIEEPGGPGGLLLGDLPASAVYDCGDEG